MRRRLRVAILISHVMALWAAGFLCIEIESRKVLGSYALRADLALCY